MSSSPHRAWVRTVPPATRRAAVAAVAAAALTACGVEWVPEVGPPLTGACDGADSDPDTDVSFARDLRPLFDRGRGMGGCSCHTPTNGSPSGIELGGLSLGSVHALRQGGRVSGAAIVVPGDPCASVLVQKLEGTPPFGARMPLDGPPYLTAAELTLIRDWIAEGAHDD
ncbi:MAG: hypothetical protein HS111_31075 [Kofleriaceae bacterium]|nr:hypothetical protein [Kofleriaceae bacterium]MCL4227514.1 hypothetical protein [Myxococcales bacterium]